MAFVRFAVATIEVERTLTKGVVPGPSVDMEILIIRWDQVSDLQKRMPNERALEMMRPYRIGPEQPGQPGSDT